MAQIRSTRRSSGLRGGVGVLPFPEIEMGQASARSNTTWLLGAVAVAAVYLLVRVAVAQNMGATSYISAVPAGTLIPLQGNADTESESKALSVSQPSIQAERLQGSSADNYFQPTGGSDLQAGGSGDSLQMTQSSYSQQGSVGTSRR